jgi:hypothetical protein
MFARVDARKPATISERKPGEAVSSNEEIAFEI